MYAMVDLSTGKFMAKPVGGDVVLFKCFDNDMVKYNSRSHK